MPVNKLKRWNTVKYQELRKLDKVTLFTLKDNHVKLDLITNDAYSFSSFIIIEIILHFLTKICLRICFVIHKNIMLKSVNSRLH